MNRSKPSIVVGGGEMKRATSSVVSSAKSDGASDGAQLAEPDLPPVSTGSCCRQSLLTARGGRRLEGLHAELRHGKASFPLEHPPEHLRTPPRVRQGLRGFVVRMREPPRLRRHAPRVVVIRGCAPDDVVRIVLQPRHARALITVPQMMLSESLVPQMMLSQSAPPQSVPQMMLSASSVPQMMLSPMNRVPQMMLSSSNWVPQMMLSNPRRTCPR